MTSKNILVTGGFGFIGRNFRALMRRVPDCSVALLGRKDDDGTFRGLLAEADVVVHLAGVNRPPSETEFDEVNRGLTERMTTILADLGRAPLILFSSSTQVALDNAYGRSKSAAESSLARFAESSGARVRIFRLPGVFGKWARPNYNSVVATFCHNVTRGLPLKVDVPEKMIRLVYVDDVVAAMERLISAPGESTVSYHEVEPRYEVTLEDLAARITACMAMRTSLEVPDLSDDLNRKLYSTVVSYLPEDAFRYDLESRTDPRGSLAEVLKSPRFGQVFVSRTKPGITRGNHYHDSKIEKFCVIAGEASIRFRHLEREDVIEYRVRGEEYAVLDIPPGYTHSIQNVGDGEMIVLFWANEPFDPQRPDTYFEEVILA